MTTQNRDVHRSAVYRAEDQWSATLDRGGVVDFFGSVIDVPEQLRFGALEAVQTACGRCRGAAEVTAASAGSTPPRERALARGEISSTPPAG